MLSFIIGRQNSGKGKALEEAMLKSAAAGQKTIFLVPDQFSFESERALLRLGQGRAIPHLEVFGFARLCNAVFREYGGLAGQYLDVSGKLLLMDIALSQVADGLTVYQKAASRPGFATMVLGTLTRLKVTGVTPELLAEAAELAAPGYEKDKLSDLRLIYTTYQGLVDMEYLDPLDDMKRAARLAGQGGFFEGAAIFVSHFRDFSRSQLELIQVMVEQAAAVTFAFCADGPDDRAQGMGLFSDVKKTMGVLKRLANEAGVPIRVPRVLEGEGDGFDRAEELRFLERNLFAPVKGQWKGTPKAIALYRCKNRYDEVDQVAAEVCRLVREEGLRYSDIQVITHSPEKYRDIVAASFKRYHLPFFMAGAENIDHHPVIVLVQSALTAISGRFKTEDVLRYCKTQLTGLSIEETALLENYSFIWNITGELWLRPFTFHPKGFAEALTEEDAALLGQLEELRLRLVGPLVALKEKAGDTYRSISVALYTFLTSIGLGENAKAVAGLFSDRYGDEDTLRFYERVYDAMIDVLDEIALLYGEQRASLSTYNQVFSLAISSLDLSDIPQTLDQVQVSEANRAVMGQVKALFALGVTEGEFPAAYESDPLLPDEELASLDGFELDLGDGAVEHSVRERFFAYRALSAPSSQLWLLSPKADLKGNALMPSELMGEVQGIFPELSVVDTDFTDPLALAQTPESAFEVFAAQHRRNTPLRQSLASALEKQPGYAKRIQGLERFVSGGEFAIADKGLAAKLYGKKLRVSPSKVERFYQCRFAYFCKNALRIDPRKRAELSPLETGSLIHYVLQVELSRYPFEEFCALARSAIRADVKKLLGQYIEENMGGQQEKPARFHYLVSRAQRALVDLLVHLQSELGQSEFRPTEFEKTIQQGSDVEPMELLLPDGRQVLVEGVVDRIDTMEKNGKRYVRVVDYKSGEKKFSLTDVYYGLNIQMLIYLFAIWGSEKGPYAGSIPAGVLYLPAKNVNIPASRGESEEALEKRALSAYQMSGLVLSDDTVVRGMEKEAEGVFIPVKAGKDGGLSKLSSVASLEQLGRIRRHVERLLYDMAEALTGGDIKAAPTVVSRCPCQYCDYRSICLMEDSDLPEKKEAIKADDFYKKLEEEV